MSIVAVVSDLHVGSTTAIAPPTFRIHVRERREAQEVNANELQRWLYECWQDYWGYVFGLAKRKRERVYILIMGDVIDGDRSRGVQSIPEVQDQMNVAEELLEPIVHRARACYGVIGTAYHGGAAGVNESKVYRDLGFAEYGQHLAKRADGLVHDMGHHGRAGRRSWTSQAPGMAAEAIIDYATQGLPPPAYVWRGHNHHIDDSGTKVAGTRAIALPSWELKTEFGWHFSLERSDIGGYIVADGVLDESRCRYFGSPDNIEVTDVD